MENLEHININGVEYYRLYCCDPAEIRNGTANIEHHFWKHYKCGGDIYIGDNAHFLCRSCGETWSVKLSAFITPSAASNINDFYISPSKVELDSIETIGLAGLITNYTGLDWLNQFLTNLHEQYRNC